MKFVDRSLSVFLHLIDNGTTLAAQGDLGCLGYRSFIQQGLIQPGPRLRPVVSSDLWSCAIPDLRRERPVQRGFDSPSETLAFYAGCSQLRCTPCYLSPVSTLPIANLSAPARWLRRRRPNARYADRILHNVDSSSSHMVEHSETSIWRTTSDFKFAFCPRMHLPTVSYRTGSDVYVYCLTILGGLSRATRERSSEHGLSFPFGTPGLYAGGFYRGHLPNPCRLPILSRSWIRALAVLAANCAVAIGMRSLIPQGRNVAAYQLSDVARDLNAQLVLEFSLSLSQRLPDLVIQPQHDPNVCVVLSGGNLRERSFRREAYDGRSEALQVDWLLNERGTRRSLS
ncbi:hypothetical protein NMY22_g4509 [Coprinellus aureogranulatus]|nr:hypothetical protein NMY22_g4509 [Coprinellus aureogranulatus]